jgi:hypothetical protein
MTKRNRQADPSLHLWNVFDLWDAIERRLCLGDDAELAGELRRHFIEVIREFTRGRSAEMTSWSKEESDLLLSLITLTEALRENIDKISKSDPGARLLRRLSRRMKVKTTKEEMDDLVSTGRVSLKEANELWSVWTRPPPDTNADPIQEFRYALLRIRRAADHLRRLPKRQRWGQTKLARDRAIKGLWEIWRKSPAATRTPLSGGKTPAAFLSFVDAVNRKLPSDLRLGDRKQVRDTISKKNLLSGA